MSEKQPSAEAISLVIKIKGKYRYGDPLDEADALKIDAFAERRAAEAHRAAIEECANCTTATERRDDRH